MGLHRVLRDVQCLGDLPDRQFLVVVQYETGPLPFGQETQRIEHGDSFIPGDRIVDGLTRSRRQISSVAMSK